MSARRRMDAAAVMTMARKVDAAQEAATAAQAELRRAARDRDTFRAGLEVAGDEVVRLRSALAVIAEEGGPRIAALARSALDGSWDPRKDAGTEPEPPRNDPA